MRHHYNLIANDSGPVIRDCPVYDATSITRGEVLTLGTTTRGAVLISSASATPTDVVGVAHETVAASTTVLTTGTLVFCKTILNPDAIYLAEYDLTASTDIDVSSSTSTATTLGTCDDDLDGSWIYINSGTGQGQLGYIGAATTTVMTLDTTTAWATTPDSSSDCVLIRRPWQYPAGSGNDLEATGIKLLADEDETGEILKLENYIETSKIPFGPLRPRQHHMLVNIHNDGPKFYSDIHLIDNVFTVSTMPTS